MYFSISVQTAPRGLRIFSVHPVISAHCWAAHTWTPFSLLILSYLSVPFLPLACRISFSFFTTTGTLISVPLANILGFSCKNHSNYYIMKQKKKILLIHMYVFQPFERMDIYVVSKKVSDNTDANKRHLYKDLMLLSFTLTRGAPPFTFSQPPSTSSPASSSISSSSRSFFLGFRFFTSFLSAFSASWVLKTKKTIKISRKVDFYHKLQK